MFTGRLRAVLAVLAMAIACAAIAGCGGDSSSSSSSSASTTGDATASLPSGGTLRIGRTGASATDVLDGQKISSSWAYGADLQIFENLMYRDAEFGLVPELATGMKASDANKTWVISLRRGVRFSDGTPFGADDVVYSIKRIADPDFGSYAYPNFAAVDTVTKVDDSTVKVTLRSPNAYFPEGFTVPGASILPASFDPKHPVGTGAFMVDSFAPGRSVSFKPNPHYWREAEPHVSRLELIAFKDGTSLVNALQADEIDVAAGLDGSQISLVRGVPGVEVQSQPGGHFVTFTMDTKQKPFDDLRVRKALALIVDRPQMISQALAGAGRVGNDLTSPDDPCYASDIPQRTQDIAEAKRLLAEAGQSDLKVTYVTAPVTPGAVSMGEVLKRQAAAAGVDVTVRVVDAATYFAGYGRWAFSFDYWPQLGVGLQLNSEFAPGAPSNTPHWSPPAFVKGLNELLATTDEAKRCTMVRDLQQQVYDGVPWIVWGFNNIIDATRDNVLGVVPDKSGLGINALRYRELAVKG